MVSLLIVVSLLGYILFKANFIREFAFALLIPLILWAVTNSAKYHAAFENWNADILVDSKDPSWLSTSFWMDAFSAGQDMDKNPVDEANIDKKAHKEGNGKPWNDLDENCITWLSNYCNNYPERGLIIKWFFNPPVLDKQNWMEDDHYQEILKKSYVDKHKSTSKKEMKKILINEIEGMESQTAKEVFDELEENDTYLFEDDFKVWKKSSLRPTKLSLLLEELNKRNG